MDYELSQFIKNARFLSFFLAGYFLNKDDFQMLRSNKAKVVAATVMFVVTIGIVYFSDLDEKWFFGSKPYGELESEAILGMLKRTGIYTLQFLMAGSFFAFVPRRRFFLQGGKKYTVRLLASWLYHSLV